MSSRIKKLALKDLVKKSVDDLKNDRNLTKDDLAEMVLTWAKKHHESVSDDEGSCPPWAKVMMGKQDEMLAKQDAMRRDIDALKVDVSSLQSGAEESRTHHAEAASRLDALEKVSLRMRVEAEHQEQYGRKDQLMIHGLKPEVAKDSGGNVKKDSGGKNYAQVSRLKSLSFLRETLASK